MRWSLGTILLVLSFSIYAEENPPPPTEEDFFSSIPQILSSTRLAQPLSDAPNAITIIDREMIKASGAVEIADLLRLVPGTQVAHKSGNEFVVTIHGLSDQWPRRLQVLVDGRSAHLPLPAAIDWVNLGIAIEDIERIEVVRGSNSPIYGSNALLGAINIVTRAAFQERGEFLQSLIGPVGTRSLIYRTGDSYKKMDYRFTAKFHEDTGFDNIYDSKENVLLSFKTNYNLSAKDTIEGNISYKYGPLQLGDGSGDNPERDRLTKLFSAIFSWGKITSAESETRLHYYFNYYNQNDRFRSLISDYYNILPADVNANFGVPDQQILSGLHSGIAKKHDLQAEYVFVPKKAFRSIVGLGIRWEEAKSYTLFSDNKPHTDYGPRFFAHTEWQPQNKVIVNAGIMLERNKLIGTMGSPRLALNYKILPRHTIRAGITRGLRSPSIYEHQVNYGVRLSDGTLIDQLRTNTTSLSPEELTSFEIGFVGEWPQYNLSYDARLFREELNNMISDPLNPSIVDTASDGAMQIVNAGKTDTTGLEFQFSYRPQANTRIIFHSGFANSAGDLLLNLSSQQKINLKGTVPRYTLGTLISHQLKNGSQAGFTVYYLDDMTWLGEGSKIPSYGRIDFRLGKEIFLGKGSSDISFVIQNVFNNYSEFNNENVFDSRFYFKFNLNF